MGAFNLYALNRHRPRWAGPVPTELAQLELCPHGSASPERGAGWDEGITTYVQSTAVWKNGQGLMLSYHEETMEAERLGCGEGAMHPDRSCTQIFPEK